MASGYQGGGTETKSASTCAFGNAPTPNFIHGRDEINKLCNTWDKKYTTQRMMTVQIAYVNQGAHMTETHEAAGLGNTAM